MTSKTIGVLSLAMLLAACASEAEVDGHPAGGPDGGSTATGGGLGVDGGGWADANLGGSTAGTGGATGGGAGTGAGGGSGGTPSSCDPRFGIPSNVQEGKPFDVSFTDTTPYAYVDLKVSGPGGPQSAWGGVAGSGSYTWTYSVSGHAAGTLDMTFVKDANTTPGTAVASCSLAVQPGSGGTGGTSGLPSCGQLAQQKGWANASCEWNGNGACNGQGAPTSDCDHCCEVGGGTGGTTGGTGFGYPVGDKSTNPAGGWVIWQTLSHYWSDYNGRHLAQDISSPGGGVAAVDAPVYSVADGVVMYARTNTSSYKNVIAIKHDAGNGTKVCSFYGHIWDLKVKAGDTVSRGQMIARVINWANAVTKGLAQNSHLHYVLVNEALCDLSVTHNLCGYDTGDDSNAMPRTNWTAEPYYYTAVKDACSGWTVKDGFISPSKFIQDHHF